MSDSLLTIAEKYITYMPKLSTPIDAGRVANPGGGLARDGALHFLPSQVAACAERLGLSIDICVVDVIK